MQDDLKRIAPGQAAIATLIGRYYAMDRDRRWDRTRLAYDAMVRGIGVRAPDPVAAVKAALARGETDEFVKPIVLEKDGQPVATIKDNDGVLCFNYRSDRMRQIVRALITDRFDGFDVHDRPRVSMVTMTQYDRTFAVPQAFPPFTMARIVAEVLADCGRTQLRTAETEKYPARHLLLQRRIRTAVQRRRTLPGAVPESGDLRSRSGDERRGDHRCTVRRHREEES